MIALEKELEKKGGKDTEKDGAAAQKRTWYNMMTSF